MAYQSIQWAVEVQKNARWGEEEYFDSYLDIQNCGNYKGIKLMSHVIKFWGRVIENKLRKETHISKNTIWFDAWEINYKLSIFYRTWWKNIKVESKTYIWCSLTWKKKLMIKWQEKFYERHWKRKGSISPIFKLSRICTIKQQQTWELKDG